MSMMVNRSMTPPYEKKKCKTCKVEKDAELCFSGRHRACNTCRAEQRKEAKASTEVEKYSGPYGPHVVDAALTVYAITRSSPKAAEAAGVSAETVLDWAKRKFRDRFHEIQTRESARIEAQAANRARTIFEKAGHAEEMYLDKITDPGFIEKLEPRDVANTLRNVSTVKGINTDHMLKLEGRPTNVTEVRDPDQYLKQLAERFPHVLRVDAEADAEEID